MQKLLQLRVWCGGPCFSPGSFNSPSRPGLLFYMPLLAKCIDIATVCAMIFHSSLSFYLLDRRQGSHSLKQCIVSPTLPSKEKLQHGPTLQLPGSN